MRQIQHAAYLSSHVSDSEMIAQNEKKKDKDLTERIARILKLRDEAIEGVDLSKPLLPCKCHIELTSGPAKIEHHVDKLVSLPRRFIRYIHLF